MKKLLASLGFLLAMQAQAAIITTPLPVTLQNGQTADATQVMSNFNAIVTGVNANAAPLSTSAQTNLANTFTQPQAIPAGTALGHAANIAQLDQNSTKYMTDTGAANAYVVTSAPAWASYIAGSDLFVKIGAGNTSTGAATINVNALGAKNILNEDGSTPEVNALLQNQVYHLVYDGTQFEIVGKNNTAVTQAVGDSTTKVATTAFVYLQLPAGTVLDYAGTAVPTGFLATDGSAVSRTTYAALFTAIGITWGSGDGSTTFNVPNFNGRVAMADGTAVVTETTAINLSPANQQVVASNNAKWVTGQTVRVSSSGTLPTGLSVATDYFLIRQDATHVSFATTLANAQNGVVITITGGSGNITITTSGATAQSYSTHTVAENGGEEKHAQSITELLSHIHGTGLIQQGAGVSAFSGGASFPAANTSATGGNAAANVMTTFAIVKKIIKY